MTWRNIRDWLFRLLHLHVGDSDIEIQGRIRVGGDNEQPLIPGQQVPITKTSDSD